MRGAMFATLCLMTYFKVYLALFGADWWLIQGLFWFAWTFSYWIYIGNMYGTDVTTGDKRIAGAILGFHLNFGIFFGSTFSLIVFA